MGIIVRQLTVHDLPSYALAFSTTVQRALRVNSWQSECAYLTHCLSSSMPFVYGIFLDDATTVIGALLIRDKQEYAGQLYCWLNEKFWGRGYMHAALHTVAREYFESTGELFFTAHVDKSNVRSYQCLKKIGFADYGLHTAAHGRQYVLVLCAGSISLYTHTPYLSTAA